MIFEELFLQSQHHDCLGQILSFLNCTNLASVARTCKVLQQTIFEAEDGNVNLIWQGAEEALTNPWGRQKVFLTDNVRRTGSNAREHCHLFALASKAAASCEHSDEIEENRIKVDGVLVDLMNLRGYDAESVAEKKAFAANETQTMEEASESITFTNQGTMSDEEREERRQRDREEALQRKEELEKLKELVEPPKTYHHDIFVRITRTATGEMISEGFCESVETVPWFAGLEWCSPMNPAALQVILDFDSLEGIMPDNVKEKYSGLNLTAVVIDRRNHNIQCLFQHDQTKETGLHMTGPGNGLFRYFTKYMFALHPRWGSDSIQLGPSIASNSYCLGFPLCVCVSPEQIPEDQRLAVPLLEISVRQDESAFMEAFKRNMTAQRGVTFL